MISPTWAHGRKRVDSDFKDAWERVYDETLRMKKVALVWTEMSNQRGGCLGDEANHSE